MRRGLIATCHRPFQQETKAQRVCARHHGERGDNNRWGLGELEIDISPNLSLMNLGKGCKHVRCTIMASRRVDQFGSRLHMGTMEGGGWMMLRCAYPHIPA